MVSMLASNMRASAASGFGIDIDIEPSPIILAAQFVAIGAAFEDFTEPLEKSVKDVMMPSIRKNFQAQGRPPWAPLSQATLNRRRQDGRGITGRILSRTTALLRRATSFGIWKIEGRAGQAYVSDLGGDVWYGKLHQEGFEGSGGGIGRIVRGGVPQIPSASLRAGDTVVEGFAGDIPARPFLVVQPEDVDDIEDVFGNWAYVVFIRHGWPG